MGAKSRRIGADAERAVVNYAESLGLPAMRVRRTGSSRDADEGDVHLFGGQVVLQVKAGQMAKHASQHQVMTWHVELERQVQQVPMCDMAFLVVQPPAVGTSRMGLWFAYTFASDLGWDSGGMPVRVRMSLMEALALADWRLAHE